ncbi:MAG: DNA repair protein RecO [Bacteroidetes bacterium]|nr:DNA repair protein RecO [Bacteroidota bacterium]MCW5894496.1 DNA repair protein RecO [Bacteroidota bacterium]
MIVKTEGVVLSKMKYRDTSKILRLYTREFGKISVIAKGAREAKSKFRSALEPMNHVACVIYKKDNRDLQLLSQCDVVTPFRYLSEDMEKMRVGLSVVELADIASHAEERNEILFSLLVDVLQTVNAATKNAVYALYYFEMKMSAILGFDPQLESCVHCNVGIPEGLEESGRYVVTHDGILCKNCSDNSGRKGISASSVRSLQQMRHATTSESVMNMNLSPSVNEEVQYSLHRHLRHHIEGFRGLRSEEVFATLL